MSKLTDKTLIPVGLAVIVIGGGAWWLSALYSDVQYTKAEVAEIKADVKTLLGRSKNVAGPSRAPAQDSCPPGFKGFYSAVD